VEDPLPAQTFDAFQELLAGSAKAIRLSYPSFARLQCLAAILRGVALAYRRGYSGELAAHLDARIRGALTCPERIRAPVRLDLVSDVRYCLIILAGEACDHADPDVRRLAPLFLALAQCLVLHIDFLPGTLALIREFLQAKHA
jgi:hypothetical protein